MIYIFILGFQMYSLNYVFVVYDLTTETFSIIFTYHILNQPSLWRMRWWVLYKFESWYDGILSCISSSWSFSVSYLFLSFLGLVSFFGYNISDHNLNNYLPGFLYIWYEVLGFFPALFVVGLEIECFMVKSHVYL